MKKALFHLNQAILGLREDWETGLYPEDKKDKEEVMRHLQIVSCLVNLSMPKFVKAKQLSEERKELDGATRKFQNQLVRIFEGRYPDEIGADPT